jgi:glutamate 5-kinase
VLTDILAGKEIGTYFKPQCQMPAVKRWIAYGASIKGQIHVNEGAKKAILDGSSLLPVGVSKLIGNFSAGDVVGIVGPDNVEFAKGNSNYNSGELNLIKGLQIKEVKKKLGYIRQKEVIEHKHIHLLREKRDT